MCRWLGGWLLWTWLFGAILGAAIYYSVPAKASPGDDYAARYATAICKTLDEFPSFGGILGVASVIVAQGYTSEDAGTAIRDSVITVCRRHLGLIEAFYNAYAPKGQLA